MPEAAQAGVATNPGQPLASVGTPATEREVAMIGVYTPVVTAAVVGTPASE